MYVRSRLHAQIEPIQVALLSTRDHPAVYSLVFDLAVVVPASGRDGKREGCVAPVWARSCLCKLNACNKSV